MVRMEKNLINKYYNYSKETQSVKYMRNLYTAMMVGTLIFTVAMIVLFIIFIAYQKKDGYISCSIGLLFGVMIFVALFSRFSHVFSVVHISDDGISLQTKFFRKRFFAWEKILSITKIKLQSVSRGGVFSMDAIVIQKDIDVPYKEIENPSLINDKTNLVIVYTPERLKEIMELWNTNKREVHF